MHNGASVPVHAAQPAHAADAAARPQDRGYFDGQHQRERDPVLSVAAHLMGIPLDGRPSRQLPATPG